MDINDFSEIEKAAGFGRSELFRLGSALLFIIAIMLYSSTFIEDVPGGVMLIIAAMIGVESVPLVQSDYQRPAFGQYVAQQRRVLVRQTLAGIEHQHDDMRPLDGLQRLDRAELLERFRNPGPAPHTGGVDQLVLLTVPLEFNADGIPRSAGLVVGQHPLLAEQPVDQRGLADVRPPHDGQPQAVRFLWLLVRERPA